MNKPVPTKGDNKQHKPEAQHATKPGQPATRDPAKPQTKPTASRSPGKPAGTKQ